MAQRQEYLVSCGTTKTAARLPADRTRVPPGPPPSVAPLPDAEAAFRRAVSQPVGMLDLEKLAQPSGPSEITAPSGGVHTQQAGAQSCRVV